MDKFRSGFSFNCNPMHPNNKKNNENNYKINNKNNQKYHHNNININNKKSSPWPKTLEEMTSSFEVQQRLFDLAFWPMEQINGGRIYGPSPSWRGAPPPRGSEVFIGKLPRDCFEDELMPVLLSIGKVYHLRLMMDFSRFNRGFAFAMFDSPETASKAVNILNGFPIRPENRLGAAISVDNRRLLLQGLSRNLIAADVAAILQSRGVEGLEVIEIHYNLNKGNALIEFESHMAASQARRIMVPTCQDAFGKNTVLDWAHPKFPSIMDIVKVKTLCIKNFSSSSTYYDVLTEVRTKIHPIEIQKFTMKEGSAIVEFADRANAEIAFNKLKNCVIQNSVVNVQWDNHAMRNGFVVRQANPLKNVTNTTIFNN